MSIDWKDVRRVLVVRLRSIGDTVLATPSLAALRRHLPDAQIDILLEDWVAPLLEGLEDIDNVVSIGKGMSERLKTALFLRRVGYDVVFNLHGGTTSTFLTRATGAPHRIGFANYQYSAFYTDLLSSASDLWKQDKTHSAEQQLALLGFAGIPVEDRPKSRLPVTNEALSSLEAKSRLRQFEISDPRSLIALIHPAAAFATKQWPTENFARTVDFLHEKGITCVAVSSKNESKLLEELAASSNAPVITFDDLTLPEITALASQAKVFVGNDSGIAHIAAAVETPSVVVFGSSNRDHWRPWTDAPNEIVFEHFECQPCPGYRCEVYGDPKCIKSVSATRVIDAVERVLKGIVS